MTTPTARTLQRLRKLGYLAGVVERFNHHTKTRHDLFGCIDLVAISVEHGTLGVQATSGSNLASRVEKSLWIPELCVWLAAGNRFECWGWRKLKHGKNSVRWEPRIVELTLVDGTPQAGAQA